MNYLRISCRHNAPSKYLSVLFYKFEGILLIRLQYNYQNQEIDKHYYLIYRTYSDFTICYNGFFNKDVS